MDYHYTGTPFARGNGTLLSYDHYGIQADTMDTSHARQVGDDAMNETFDFPGYYGDYATDSVAANPQQDMIQSHRGKDVDSVPAGEVEYRDGPPDVLASALASYYSSNPLTDPLIPPVSSVLERGFIDPPGFHDMQQLATLPTVEKWDVDKSTMEYLVAILAVSASEGSLLARCGLRPHLRDIKLEEPVLSSDPATDMQRLRERNVVRLDTQCIKPIPLDKRHDQGLQWSAKSLRLPEETDKLIAAEKMMVNGDTVDFLKEVFEGMQGDPITPLSRNSQDRAPWRPVTPPLLPLSPPYSPGSIPSTAARLPLTSTPEDLLVQEAAELEARMMTTEDLDATQADGMDQDIVTPLKISTSSSSPLRRKFDKISDLKISSPLLPCVLTEPPTKKAKNVSFAEEIETLLPPRDSDMSSTDPFVAADQALAAVGKILEPLAQTAMGQGSNETLVEIDTTVRVDVPLVGEVVPDAPWAIYAGRPQALLGEIRAEVTKMEKRWTGASSLERLLPWSPFPAHLGKAKPEGEFDDGSLARYLSELDIEERVDLQQMAWKPEGLRVLDLDDDEEKLDVCNYKHLDHHTLPGHPPHGTQIANMVPRDSTKSFQVSSTQLPLNATGKVPMATAVIPLAAQSKLHPQRLRETAPQSVGTEPNSMQALLEKRRLQLQLEKETLLLSNNNRSLPIGGGQVPVGRNTGAPVEKSGLSAFMAVQGVREVHLPPVPKADQAEAIVENRRPEPTIPAAKPRLNIPAPKIIPSKLSLPIVVSSTVVASRRLMRKLQQHLPTLNIIERETTISHGKQIPTSSPAREADLTLSPSTGLIFTTLQKLKQKPLPGQGASFIGIRDHIAQVAPRYERLIVLLSEGSHSTSEEGLTHIRTLDERDSTAIADFIGFFSRFDTEVQVSYVPGGEEELSKWIAVAVSRWAPCLEHFHLLEEETVWERFLRQAGMNVFAAQVVLDSLKPPLSEFEVEDSRGVGYEGYGLAAFVRMDAEERVRRFGALIGGEGMLRRVSRAVDGPWTAGIKGR